VLVDDEEAALEDDPPLPAAVELVALVSVVDVEAASSPPPHEGAYAIARSVATSSTLKRVEASIRA
jgi:hypothetical protein